MRNPKPETGSPIEIRNPNDRGTRIRACLFGLQSGLWFSLGDPESPRDERRISGFRGRAAAAAALFALLLVLPSRGRGETVVCNDGKSYTGTVTVTAHEAICVTPGIKRTFALPVVSDIELSGAERAEFEGMCRKLQPLDAVTLYRVGMWLKSKHQHGMAQEYFGKAVNVEANHAEARRELGFARKGDRWEYSPALHQERMYEWVGRKALDFHLKLATQLHALKLTAPEEKELRRVIQADGINPTAIAMLRPIVAQYRVKNNYRLPFVGTWAAISGPTVGLGHGDYSYMLNAWDFRRVNARGEIGSGPENDLKSYFTFEQPMYASADGEVYEIKDGFPDNPVGTVAPMDEANRILIRHANGERSVIGHLQKGSFRVKVGDKVKQGQLLALLGNSGRSTTPHLHFAIYDADGVSVPLRFVDFDALEGAVRRHVDSGGLELGKIYENHFTDTRPMTGNR